MSVEIKKIEIRIDDKILELTVDQAKELKSILGDMFEQPSITSIPYPIYVERPRKYWWSTTSGDTLALCTQT